MLYLAKNGKPMRPSIGPLVFSYSLEMADTVGWSITTAVVFSAGKLPISILFTVMGAMLLVSMLSSPPPPAFLVMPLSLAVLLLMMVSGAPVSRMKR